MKTEIPMGSFSTVTKQPHQVLMPDTPNCFNFNLKLLLSLSPEAQSQPNQPLSDINLHYQNPFCIKTYTAKKAFLFSI